MISRRRTLVAALSLLAASIIGTASADGDTPDRLDLVKQKGSLEFIVYRDYPPYSDEKAGEFSGVDVEMGKALAAALGVEVKED